MVKKGILILLIPLLLAPALAAGNWTLYFDPFAVTNWDNTINNTLLESSNSINFIPDESFLSENIIVGFVIDAPGIPGETQNISIIINHIGGSTESGFWNTTYSSFFGIQRITNDINIGSVSYQEGPYYQTSPLATVLAYSIYNNETGLITSLSPWVAFGLENLIPGYPDYKANVFPTFTTEKMISGIEVSTTYSQSFTVRILWMPKDQFANMPANLVVSPENQVSPPTLPRITVDQINQVFGFLSIFLIFIVDLEVMIATNWLWFFVIAEVTIIMLAFFESGGYIFRVPGKWWRNQKKLFDFGLWGVEQLEKHYIFFIVIGAISALGWFLQVSNVSAAWAWFLKVFGLA